MSKKYTIHSDKFKFKVALEALKGTRTIAEICKEFSLTASQIYDWKKKLEELGPQVFGSSTKSSEISEKDIEKLHATIGKLKVENDFLAKALGH